MQLDDTLCYCFHVSKRKILNHLRINRPRRASQLSDCGGAGTGCGWCVPYLGRCFEEFAKTQTLDSDGISVDSYSAARSRYVANGKVRSENDLNMSDSTPNDADSREAAP